MGMAITDERFSQALSLAAEEGIEIKFAIEPIPEANHPNTVEIRMTSRGGRKLRLRSIHWSGAIQFTRIDQWRSNSGEMLTRWLVE